jgi:hypothetical protein
LCNAANVVLITRPVFRFVAGRVLILYRSPASLARQAVDANGNVALALDHGQPFTAIEIISGDYLYLPLIRR